MGGCGCPALLDLRILQHLFGSPVFLLDSDDQTMTSDSVPGPF